MSETITFTADLSKAAELAQAQCRNGLLVHVELGKYGFVVMGRALTTVPPVVRDYKQIVPYRVAELSDGMALYEAIRRVVVGLGHTFQDINPPHDFRPST